MIHNKPTLDDVLKYEEILIDAVEKHIDYEQDQNVKTSLLKLQILLKSRAIKKFVDYINKRQFSLSCFKKIQEIDDAIDELRVMDSAIPYPEAYFILEQRKAERACRNIMVTLLCGLFGFGWVE